MCDLLQISSALPVLLAQQLGAEPDLIGHLQVAINLAEQYEAAYEHTRRQLMTQPKGKQFDFDKDRIFEKFYLFKRRLEKLVDMFTTIHQFSSLEQHTHIDGLSAMIANFHSIKDDVQVRSSHYRSISNYSIFVRA
jgi:dynein heavy chain